MEDRESKLAELRATRRLEGLGEQIKTPFRFLLILVGLVIVAALIVGIVALVVNSNPWPLTGTIVIGGPLYWIFRRLYKRWERQRYAELYEEEILNIKLKSPPQKS